jgi:serine/threonine protein kinase
LPLQVAQGLADLHSRGIVHCDLKAHNIGVNPWFSSEVKLLDFGSAQICTSDGKASCSAGVPVHHSIQSPEMAAQTCIQEVSTADDIWALGILVHTLVTGCANPWLCTDYDEEDEEQEDQAPVAGSAEEQEYTLGLVRDPSRQVVMDSARFDATCRDFVSGCLCRDVARRLTAEQALQHSWIAGAAQ